MRSFVSARTILHMVNNSFANGRAYVPLTEEDRAKFLALIAAGWTKNAAAAAVRPAATGPRAGLSTVQAALDREPDFAARFEEAREAFRNGLIQEAVRRGVTGVEEPLSYKGKLTGDTITKKSDAVLLKLLQANFPEFASQTVHRHEGTIEHRHGHVVLDASRVFLLSPEQRRQLAAMLPVLSSEQDPDQIERQTAIVDVPFEEVSNDPYAIPEGGF